MTARSWRFKSSFAHRFVSKNRRYRLKGRIAQLVRALRLHRRGPGFESLCAHTNKNNPKGLFLFVQRSTRIRTSGERVLSEVGRPSEKESDDKPELAQGLAAGLGTRAFRMTAKSEHGNPCAPTNKNNPFGLFLFV